MNLLDYIRCGIVKKPDRPMEEIREWVRNSKPIYQSTTAPLRESKNLDLDRIIKNAIDTAKGKKYNSSNGKPGQIKVSGRRLNGTV
jgi:hypothetical protein